MRLMNSKITKLDLFFSGLAIAVLLVVFLLPKSGLFTNDNLTANVVESVEEITPIPNPFENLKIEAKSAVVFDINSGEFIFEKNADTVRPLASVTKLMTIYVASKYLNDDDLITVYYTDLLPEGDSGLYADEIWKFSDLAKFTLMISSNDGASAIASNVGMKIVGTDDPDIGRREFILEMNKTADSLGLKQSYFLNPSGLDLADDKSGSYGTAKDLAILMKELLNSAPEILYYTKYLDGNFTSVSGLDHLAVNTNQAVDDLPVVLGSKTGFTDLAGGNLVLGFEAGIGKPMVVVVLGSSVEGRFTDAVALAKAGIKYLRYQEYKNQGDSLTTLKSEN